MGLLSNIFGKKAEANSTVDFNVSLSCGKCLQRVEDLMGADKAVALAKVGLASKIVYLPIEIFQKQHSSNSQHLDLSSRQNGLRFRNHRGALLCNILP